MSPSKHNHSRRPHCEVAESKLPNPLLQGFILPQNDQKVTSKSKERDQSTVPFRTFSTSLGVTIPIKPCKNWHRRRLASKEVSAGGHIEATHWITILAAPGAQLQDSWRW